MNLDSPINRATINQLTVDQLDDMLLELRSRRMEKVKKLESIARVKADDEQLIPFLRFERAIKAARKEYDKLIQQEKKFDAALHKARVIAVECAQ
jgi:hypothetical protein